MIGWTSRRGLLVTLCALVPLTAGAHEICLRTPGEEWQNTMTGDVAGVLITRSRERSRSLGRGAALPSVGSGPGSGYQIVRSGG